MCKRVSSVSEHKAREDSNQMRSSTRNLIQIIREHSITLYMCMDGTGCLK